MAATALTISILITAASTSFGHGVPIDVFVNSQGQLYAGARVYESDFDLVGGVLLLTDLPGVGVSQTTNGLFGGDALNVDVHRELLYWDGSQIAPTASELEIDNPDGDQSYFVDDTTGPQTGMFWGTYNGITGWHEDGGYILEPSTSPDGVYGLVIRLSSPSYETSQPIMIAFNYDLSEGEYEIGAAALEEAVFLTGDITADSEVDIADFTLWADSFGASGPGLKADITEDTEVDIADFTLWADNFGTTSATPGQVAAVPEPTALGMLAIGLACVAFVTVVRRRLKRLTTARCRG